MTLGNAAEVRYWIDQRERARQMRNLDAKRPYCDDPIINEYRFCNVRREDDRVTRWLKKYWRDPYWEHPNFIPAMLLARMVNWPPTLEAIGFPEKWDSKAIVDIIHDVASRGKAWTSAYVITTCGKRVDKAVYVVEGVCGAARAIPRPGPDATLQAVWTKLRAIDGLGAGFLAAQVVADLKYTPILEDAPDWWSWAVPGPGSRRGINRYFNEHPDHPMTDEVWKDALDVMISEVQPILPKAVGRLHAQDWQSVMCEYSKWKRIKEGGRGKQRYKPSNEYVV
jgi:hypothetical protein